MPTLAATWHLGEVFLVILEFAMFFILIWLLITVFADLFRSHDISGWVKAIWIIGIIIFPFLGILLYLIVRGGSMHERSVQQAQQADAAFKSYVQQTASTASTASTGTTADQLTKLADLKSKGVIDDAEFAQLKAKALAG
jgi:ABC-type multidrug transport system fused ATPase/permease subunit